MFNPPSSLSKDADANAIEGNDVDEDEGGQQQQPTPNSSGSVRSFDRRLPVNHSYLGSREQGEISSESLFVESGSEIRVPVLVMSEVCLLPGQTLPLQFYTRPSVQFLSDPQRQRSYFALLTAEHEMEIMENVEDFSRVPCHPVGTLFQIQNALNKAEDRMTLQVIGRQRCALAQPFLSRHNIHCEDLAIIICDNLSVRVLEESLLPKRIFPTLEQCSFNRLNDENERFKCLASMSPHNAYTLKQLSTDGVVQRLEKWLLNWFKRRQIELIIEQGPTQFSFWVAANIPMSLDKKLELLAEDSTDRRLRFESRIVSQMSGIVCIDCEDLKCSTDDLVNLSVEANSIHFINPGGFVHDLFTVRQVQNVRLRGEPTAEFSWFPGYEWTILECDRCGAHMGWRFTSSQLIPGQFYGISRRSFRLACVREELE